VTERWYEKTDWSALAAHELCRRLWDQTGQQRQRARKQIERYYGASLDPMLWRNRYQIADDLPLVWNMTRSLVGTVESRIGASANPKLQFVTSDATWSVRRRGQKLDQFIDALALQDCGQYSTVHELREIELRDACIFGVAWAQVDADVDAGRVITERCFPWEVMVDSRDARYGQPTTWVRTCTLSKDVLKAWYPERTQEIEIAQESSDIELEVELGLAQRTTPLRTDIVRCYHVWHCANGPDAPGRHIFLLDDHAVPLVDEDWILDFPPLIGMWWDKPLIGIASTSLADEVSSIEDEINRNIQRITDTIRRTGMATCVFPKGSIDRSRVEETRDTDLWEYDGALPPQIVSPAPFSPAHIQWIELQWEKAHDCTGVSETAAHGDKSPGVTSAVGMRAETSLQNVRFAGLSRAQGNWMIRWAELAVHAVTQIAERQKNFSVKWSGNEFLRQLSWEDISLEKDQYVMQIRVTGESKGEPADRAQRAEELLGAGLITQQAYLTIMQTTLDVQGATDRLTKQQELIDIYIDRWLDATDEQLESGWYSEEKGIRLVPPPLKWLLMPDAIMQVAQGYMRAEIDEAPDNIRDLFLQWLAMADAELESQEARKRAAAQAFQSAAMQGGQAGVAQSIMQQAGPSLNQAPAPQQGMANG
jgi:hypothetical protein